MKHQLTVIIPCYNSELYIEPNILKLNSKINKYFKGIEYIVINDGSSDKTINQLRIIKKKIKNFKIIDIKKNSGKSSAIKKALKISVGKKILLCDSDIPYFNYLDQVLTKLKFNKLVVINRRHKKSKILIKNRKIYNLIRTLIGNLISFINFYLLGIRIKDTQSGLKGFSNSLDLKKEKFISRRFFLDIEILNFFRKKNIKPVEIPVHFKLESTSSSINLFDFKKNVEIFREYLKVINNI